MTELIAFLGVYAVIAYVHYFGVLKDMNNFLGFNLQPLRALLSFAWPFFWAYIAYAMIHSTFHRSE